VGEHQEHVQDLEPDGRHGEEIDGCRALEVILKERAPSLRRWPPVANHVLADAGLTGVDTELE
jgi:hypothetical protein